MESSNRSHSYIDLSSSEEDDGEFSLADSSDTDEEDEHFHRGPIKHGFVSRWGDETNKFSTHENLANKLMKREFMFNKRGTKSFYANVPTRLHFCLKDVIPPTNVQGHVFMGLSACGQFLLSFKFCSNDNASVSHYSFSMGFKYTLFFWIYQPFKPVNTFYKCCLFDDHGVDNIKKVSMIQWKNCDPRILIVHGASEDENEDSYITYIKVPKLGCLECKKLKEFEEEDGLFRRQILCIKCNLTIHTKYSTTDSDRKFDPNIHLLCPERILIISNGFFHMLHMRLEQPPKEQQKQNQQQTSPINSHSQNSTVFMLKPVNNAENNNNTTTNNPILISSVFNADVQERRTPIQFNGTVDITDTFSIDSQSTNSQNNVVARIIEDFGDAETDSTHSGSGIVTISQVNSNGLRSPASSHNDSPISASRKSCEELLSLTNTRVNTLSPAAINNSNATLSTIGSSGINNNCVNVGGGGGGSVNLSKNTSPLIKKGPRQRHRIVTKSFRKGVSIFFSSTGLRANITAVNTSSSSNSNTNNNNTDRAAAYEFSEENEKCEKISILRKRRLADRKYEFSEDNSENIIPFTKTRTSNTFSSFISNTNTGNNSRRHNLTHLHNVSPYASPSSSPHTNQQFVNTQYPAALSPLHRSCTSPLGFRSPPSTSGIGGTVGNGSTVMRSPSRHFVTNHFYNNQKSPPHNFAHSLSPATQYMLSFKPHGTLSPLQLSMTKRTHLEVSGSLSPNHHVSVFLSPRRDDYRSVVEVPLQGGAMSEKPVCTKKFLRRFVEEDDAASVITSEEDDCISPGYHTLLPLEVHGSCYSEMQMISKASYQQLRCSSVAIEQNSFDLETFTYYAICSLCQKNQKTYDFFYDWAYEIINVCPISLTVFCILMAHFSAREEGHTCLNCSRKLNCAFHRREYECRVLFTWNMMTGEWEIIDFGELHEYNHYKYGPRNKLSSNVSLQHRAKKLAREMAQTLQKLPDYTSNLRVLESNVKKSKKSIIDIDNMLEFTLKKRPHNAD